MSCPKCWCTVCVCGEPNFYCMIKCGEADFSIEEWNAAYNEIQAMPISEEAKHKLVHPDPCKTQCEACINVVLDRKSK